MKSDMSEHLESVSSLEAENTNYKSSKHCSMATAAKCLYVEMEADNDFPRSLKSNAFITC